MFKENHLWNNQLFPLPAIEVYPGQLWRLGDHLLLIDDCTNEKNVARLQKTVGSLATAVITDPPYGKTHASWDTGSLSWCKLIDGITHSFATCISFCVAPYSFDLYQEMKSLKWAWRWECIWSKNNSGFQVSKQQPLLSHETILAFARVHVQPAFLIFNGYEAGEIGKPWGDNCKTKHTSKQVYALDRSDVRQGRSDGKRWIRSVLGGRKKQEMPAGERTKHPNQKPLELVKNLVLLTTYCGDIVYDGFLGSGTTLIACEATDRMCIGMENDLESAQITIERWQKFTNRHAILLEEGVSHDIST